MALGLLCHTCLVVLRVLSLGEYSAGFSYVKSSIFLVLKCLEVVAAMAFTVFLKIHV